MSQVQGLNQSLGYMWVTLVFSNHKMLHLSQGHQNPNGFFSDLLRIPFFSTPSQKNDKSFIPGIRLHLKKKGLQLPLIQYLQLITRCHPSYYYGPIN